jgi:hypothetical protein
MARRSKTVHINNKRWGVRIAARPLKGEWGHCDYPKREIVLCPTTDRIGNLREIVLHEVLHGIMPFLDEECVHDAAIEIDDVLDALEL